MIIIPAAGDGVRFKKAGYKGPKHLLPLAGKPMIDWVVENVRPLDPDGQVFIADRGKVGKTRGAVETIYKAIVASGLETGPLVIANCDQLIELDDEAISLAQGGDDGYIFTFQSANSAHSYVQTTKDKIFWIVEKPEVPPSDSAVAGVYWFKDVQPVLHACYSVLLGEQGDGPELYFSSAIKAMLLEGLNLYAVDVPTAILGTPEDFDRFQVALSMAGAA